EPAEVAQQCSELIDALVELLVSDGLRDLVLGLRHPDERRLVAVLREMPINAVIGGVKPTSDKPFPEGRVAGIERCVPVRIPGQQIRILPEAFRKFLLRESIEDAGVARIGLANEFRGRDEVLLFSPM